MSPLGPRKDLLLKGSPVSDLSGPVFGSPTRGREGEFS